MRQLIPKKAHLEALRLASRFLDRKKFLTQQARRKTEWRGGYSYRQFDETQSIFVHVPKCAGVSIARALYGNLAGGHTTLGEYARIFEPDRLLGYFKFGFVRNPWDRLVSAFQFLKSGGLNEFDRRWAERELGEFSQFDAFVQRWVNRQNIWKWYHFRPQYHFLTVRHDLVRMDFIGRFERLEQDFAFVCERMSWNATLEHRNAIERAPYADFYCRTTRQIVADVYERDIVQFGYAF